MTSDGKSKKALVEIADRLKADLAALIDTATATPPALTIRKQIDTELRGLISRVDRFLRDLDPVRQPRFMFDPGDPAVVGRFIALALISQPRLPLADVERFYGSGVYALYYKGGFRAYKPISGTETPIYVGKADPQSDTAKRPIEQGDRLWGRLRDHLRNIGKADNTLKTGDFQFRSLVVQSGWQGAAEDYLIHLFKPVWNNETNICYGLGKHGDDPETRANLRSPWDTLHPGRNWAWRDAKMKDARSRDQILSDLKKHFASETIYANLAQVLREFVEELRQL
jgi:hypothetical protein